MGMVAYQLCFFHSKMNLVCLQVDNNPQHSAISTVISRKDVEQTEARLPVLLIQPIYK